MRLEELTKAMLEKEVLMLRQAEQLDRNELLKKELEVEAEIAKLELSEATIDGQLIDESNVRAKKIEYARKKESLEDNLKDIRNQLDEMEKKSSRKDGPESKLRERIDKIDSAIEGLDSQLESHMKGGRLESTLETDPSRND